MHPSRLVLFLIGLSWYLPLHRVLAVLVNTTIDDTYGDPDTGIKFTYTPAQSWNYGPSCVGCTAHPDPEFIGNRTWHDGTFNPVLGSTPESILSASVSFSGTAVYVYCIIAHTSTSPDGNTDMTFLLDGVRVGQYNLAPTNSTVYSYNVPVYVNTDILPSPSQTHTFSIETGHGGLKALVMLDYLVYSHDVPAPSKNTIIVAAVISPIVFVLVVLATVLLFRRYMRKRGKPYALDLTSQFSHSRPESFIQVYPQHQPWMPDPRVIQSTPQSLTRSAPPRSTSLPWSVSTPPRSTSLPSSEPRPVKVMYGSQVPYATPKSKKLRNEYFHPPPAYKVVNSSETDHSSISVVDR